MSLFAHIRQKVVIHITVDEYIKKYKFKTVFTWLLESWAVLAYIHSYFAFSKKLISDREIICRPPRANICFSKNMALILIVFTIGPCFWFFHFFIFYANL